MSALSSTDYGREAWTTVVTEDEQGSFTRSLPDLDRLANRITK